MGINNLFMLLYLSGCALRKNYIDIFKSPCMDGTHINMHKAGCVYFDWGIDHTGSILKTRCTYSMKDNWWTTTTFYTIPHYHREVPKNWERFCEDRQIKMFIMQEKKCK